MTNNRWRRVDKLKGNKRDLELLYQLYGIDTSKPVSKYYKKFAAVTDKKLTKVTRQAIQKYPLLVGMGTYEENKRLKANQRFVRTMTIAKPLKQGMHHKKNGKKI